jgi:hypothetical protein
MIVPHSAFIDEELLGEASRTRGRVLRFELWFSIEMTLIVRWPQWSTNTSQPTNLQPLQLQLVFERKDGAHRT